MGNKRKMSSFIIFIVFVIIVILWFSYDKKNANVLFERIQSEYSELKTTDNLDSKVKDKYNYIEYGNYRQPENEVFLTLYNGEKWIIHSSLCINFEDVSLDKVISKNVNIKKNINSDTLIINEKYLFILD